jgi:hypothetical protein
MNTEIINNFIQYYIGVFNDKTKFNEYMVIWKEYSTLTYNDINYTGQSLIDILKHIYALNIDISDPKYFKSSFMLIGDRRANILLSYRMIDSNGQILNISQYIQLAYSNLKEYWIHSSLLNLI